MIVEHDSARDQLDIRLRDDLVNATVRTVELDERRRLDYTAEGELVGVGRSTSPQAVSTPTGCRRARP